MEKTLIIGFGNPGRVDDGLGPSCIKMLENLNLNENYFTLDSDYQLTLETSFEIAEHDEVIFIDASISPEEPFYFKPVLESKEEGFSTHSISPEALMQLTRCLYDKAPKATMLGIKGYHFDEFGEYLSIKAEENLNRAFNFLKAYLLNKTLQQQTKTN